LTTEVVVVVVISSYNRMRLCRRWSRRGDIVVVVVVVVVVAIWFKYFSFLHAPPPGHIVGSGTSTIQIQNSLHLLCTIGLQPRL